MFKLRKYTKIDRDLIKYILKEVKKSKRKKKKYILFEIPITLAASKYIRKNKRIKKIEYHYNGHEIYPDQFAFTIETN